MADYSPCPWTKIEDGCEMPKHGDSVLITCKNGYSKHLYHGTWCNITKGFNILDGGSNVINIKGTPNIATHWMPEVELPKDV